MALRRLTDVFQDRYGTAVDGASVTITNSSDGSPAVLYATRGATSPIGTNVLTTNPRGIFDCYVEDGEYSVSVFDGVETYLYPNRWVGAGPQGATVTPSGTMRVSLVDSTRPVGSRLVSATVEAIADFVAENLPPVDGNTDSPTLTIKGRVDSGTGPTQDLTATQALGLLGVSLPSSGNATSGQVVKGNDTRLTDSRAPTAHVQDISSITGLTAALAELEESIGEAGPSFDTAALTIVDADSILVRKADNSYVKMNAALLSLYMNDVPFGLVIGDTGNNMPAIIAKHDQLRALGGRRLRLPAGLLMVSGAPWHPSIAVEGAGCGVTILRAINNVPLLTIYRRREPSPDVFEIGDYPADTRAIFYVLARTQGNQGTDAWRPTFQKFTMEGRKLQQSNNPVSAIYCERGKNDPQYIEFSPDGEAKSYSGATVNDVEISGFSGTGIECMPDRQRAAITNTRSLNNGIASGGVVVTRAYGISLRGNDSLIHPGCGSGGNTGPALYGGNISGFNVIQVNCWPGRPEADDMAVCIEVNDCNHFLITGNTINGLVYTHCGVSSNNAGRPGTITGNTFNLADEIHEPGDVSGASSHIPSEEFNACIVNKGFRNVISAGNTRGPDKNGKALKYLASSTQSGRLRDDAIQTSEPGRAGHTAALPYFWDDEENPNVRYHWFDPYTGLTRSNHDIVYERSFTADIDVGTTDITSTELSAPSAPTLAADVIYRTELDTVAASVGDRILPLASVDRGTTVVLFQSSGGARGHSLCDIDPGDMSGNGTLLTVNTATNLLLHDGATVLVGALDGGTQSTIDGITVYGKITRTGVKQFTMPYSGPAGTTTIKFDLLRQEMLCAPSIFREINRMLGGALFRLATFCVGGQNTGQKVSQFRSVMALKPTHVYGDMGMNNDVLDTIPYSTTINNLKTMMLPMLSAGIRLWFPLPPAIIVASGQRLANALYMTEWLRGMARQYPTLTLLEQYRHTVDPTTGLSYPTLIADNLYHQSAEGASVYASAMVPIISQQIHGGWPEFLVNDLNDRRSISAGSQQLASWGWSSSGQDPALLDSKATGVCDLGVGDISTGGSAGRSAVFSLVPRADRKGYDNVCRFTGIAGDAISVNFVGRPAELLTTLVVPNGVYDVGCDFYVRAPAGVVRGWELAIDATMNYRSFTNAYGRPSAYQTLDTNAAEPPMQVSAVGPAYFPRFTLPNFTSCSQFALSQNVVLDAAGTVTFALGRATIRRVA